MSNILDLKPQNLMNNAERTVFEFLKRFLIRRNTTGKKSKFCVVSY